MLKLRRRHQHLSVLCFSHCLLHAFVTKFLRSKKYVSDYDNLRTFMTIALFPHTHDYGRSQLSSTFYWNSYPQKSFESFSFWILRVTNYSSVFEESAKPELYCTVVCWILTDIRREKQFSHFPRKRKWNLMKMEKYFLSYFFVNSTRKSSVLPIITQIRKKCTYHVKDKVKKQIYFPNWN